MTRILARAVLMFYLAAIALLPWAWFPSFPWLHEHAQWSDAVFAVAAGLWAIELWRNKRWPRLNSLHAAMALYVGFAALSLFFAAPDQRTGTFKLLGMVELCALALITSDMATRPRATRAIAWTIAITSLITAIAAVAGVILFYAGVSTRLIGTYGDLIPSPQYARAEAGFYQPNLLASFCIFAAAVVARRDGNLPTLMRRVTLAALGLAVALTFSRGILGFALAAAIRVSHTRFHRLLTTAFAAICVAVILTLSFWNLAFDPAHPLATHFDHSVSSSRYQTVTSSLRTLAVRPLWGSGIGTPPGEYRGRPFDAHLTPVNIAATLGLPALIAFTSMLVILWRQRSRPINLAIWSGLIGLALDALAQDVEDFRHLWVLIGLAEADWQANPASVQAAKSSG